MCPLSLLLPGAGREWRSSRGGGLFFAVVVLATELPSLFPPGAACRASSTLGRGGGQQFVPMVAFHLALRGLAPEKKKKKRKGVLASGRLLAWSNTRWAFVGVGEGDDNNLHKACVVARDFVRKEGGRGIRHPFLCGRACNGVRIYVLSGGEGEGEETRKTDSPPPLLPYLWLRHFPGCLEGTECRNSAT